jgi:hypothetical protein
MAASMSYAANPVRAWWQATARSTGMSDVFVIKPGQQRRSRE